MEQPSTGFDPLPPIQEDVGVQRQIEKAKRYYDEGDFKRALDLLQPILDGKASSFFTEDNRTYYPVAQFVRGLVLSLPPEGLRLYRLSFDPEAERLWQEYEESGDLRPLERLADSLFATSYGHEAADRLALRYFDRGEFLRAANLWKRLLTSRDAEASGMAQRADDDGWRPIDLWVKVAAAFALAGESREANEALAAARERAGEDGRVRFAGRRRELASLSSLAPFQALTSSEDTPLETRSTPDDTQPGTLDALVWLQPGGNPTHTRRPVDVTRELQRRRDWSVSLIDYRLPISQQPEDPWGRGGGFNVWGAVPYGTLNRLGNRSVPRSRPALAEGLFLYRHNGKLIAAEIDSGKRRWAAAGTGCSYLEKPSIDWGTYGDGAATGVTVSPELRLAFVVDEGIPPMKRRGAPESNPNVFGGQPEQPRQTDIETNELQAYNLSNGKLQWRWSSRYAGLALGVYLRTTPVLDGGYLYVMGESREAYECLCFDARTGKLEWRSPVAVNSGWGNVQEGQKSESGAIAIAQGVVICQTNLGVVVGVDAAGGGVLWISRYERTPLTDGYNGGRIVGMPGQPPQPAAPPARGWAAGHPVISGSRALIAPTDGKFLLCLDVQNGTLAWRRKQTSKLDCLYGADAERVYVGGKRAMALSLADGNTIWESAYEASECVGRGLVTSTEVVLPTETGFARLGRDTGKLLEVVDLPGVEADGGGSLLATDGRVVVLTHSRAHAFSSVAAAERELTLRIDKEPGKPEFRYRRGRLYLRSDRFAEGLTDLEQAYQLALVLDDRGMQLDSSKAVLDTLIDRLPSSPERLEEFVALADKNLNRIRVALSLLAEAPEVRQRLLDDLPDLDEATADAQLESGASAVGLVLGLISVTDYEVALEAAHARGLHAAGRTPDALSKLYGLIDARPDAVVEARPGWRLDMTQFVQGILRDIAAEVGREPFAPFEEEVDTALAQVEGDVTEEVARTASTELARIYDRHRASPRATDILTALARSWAVLGDPDREGRALRRMLRNHADDPGENAQAALVAARTRLVELDLAAARVHRAAANALELAVEHPERAEDAAKLLARPELSSYQDFAPAPDAPAVRKVGAKLWSIDRPEAWLVDVDGYRPAALAGTALVQLESRLQLVDVTSGEPRSEVTLLGVAPRKTEGFYLDYFMPDRREVAFLGQELVYTSVFAANSVDTGEWKLTGATKLVNVLSSRKLDDLRVKLLTGRDAHRNHYDRYAFVGDTLVVVSSSRKVTASRPPFEDDLWRTRLDDMPFGDPIPWGERVAIITNPRSLRSRSPSELVFIDVTTGDESHKVKLDDRVTEPPLPTETGMLLLVQGGRVRALSLETASTVWTRRFGRDGCTLLATEGDRAVIDTDRGVLLVVRTTDGAILHELDIGRLRRTIEARLEGNSLLVLSARPVPGTVRGLDCIRDTSLARYDLPAPGSSEGVTRTWQTLFDNHDRLAPAGLHLTAGSALVLSVSGVSVQDDTGEITTSEASITRSHLHVIDLASGAELDEFVHELKGDGPAPKVRVTPKALLIQTGGGLEAHALE